MESTATAIAEEISPKSAKQRRRPMLSPGAEEESITPSRGRKGLLKSALSLRFPRLQHEGSDITMTSSLVSEDDDEEEEVRNPTYVILENCHDRSESTSRGPRNRGNDGFVSPRKPRRASVHGSEPLRAVSRNRSHDGTNFAPLKHKRQGEPTRGVHRNRSHDGTFKSARKPRRASMDSAPQLPTRNSAPISPKVSPNNSPVPTRGVARNRSHDGAFLSPRKPRRASMDTEPTRGVFRNRSHDGSTLSPRKQRRASMEAIFNHQRQEEGVDPEVVLETIRRDTAEQIKRKEEIKATIDGLVKISSARLNYENKIGAVLTMKKIKKLQSDQVHIAEALEFLEAQESQVQNIIDKNKAACVGTKPIRRTHAMPKAEICDLSYKKELCRILKQKLEYTEASDEQLLNQLKLMAAARQSVKVLDETVTWNRVSSRRMNLSRGELESLQAQAE